jgi:SAM-dependent methyltransferase
VSDDLVRPVVDYYAARFDAFGPTAAGVDWNGEKSQALRFEQLMKLHTGDAAFTINDFGCGYGALAGYLQSRFRNFSYSGFDLAPAMLGHARDAYRDDQRIAFVDSEADLRPSSYTVASGVFHVRLGAGDEWRAYVLETLDRLWELSIAGMAFNLLTSYSDPELMRRDLWYANPAEIFDHCKRRYSKEVALLHDYGIYEFTMLVRRPGSR